MALRRNSPLTPGQATALQQILQSHGWSKANPPKYAKKRKSTWKKRFGTRKAMVRYMAKIRRLAHKKAPVRQVVYTA